MQVLYEGGGVRQGAWGRGDVYEDVKVYVKYDSVELRCG